MMRGIFPLDLLYLPEQLDALVAAYTAWLAVNKPQKTISVGDAAEGLITLPEQALMEKY
jgi:predicted RNase H-like nuclease